MLLHSSALGVVRSLPSSRALNASDRDAFTDRRTGQDNRSCTAAGIQLTRTGRSPANCSSQLAGRQAWASTRLAHA